MKHQPEPIEDWRNGGFGLYIHWPYCQSKCPYCDFNSHVAAKIDQKRWSRAYLSELRHVAVETKGRTLQTVFFGGGTPSLMDPELVADILSGVRNLWPMSNDPEITMEANPGSVDMARFAAFRMAGINRISMGVQALNDDDLRRLGRLHSVADARRAFDIARALFERVSFDLIYARQGQDINAWRAELKEALGMAVDHLSLYQLTIEQGTAFGDLLSRGRLRDLPDEDTAADLYDATEDICQAAGFHGYEISNYARPGAESRHNLIYWRYGDWAAVGPGAHGRLTLQGQRRAIENAKMPSDWLSKVEQLGSGETMRDVLSGTDAAHEYLLMSLRLSEGSSISRYGRIGGKLSKSGMQDLRELGLIRLDSDRIIPTADGKLMLNAIIRTLVAD